MDVSSILNTDESQGRSSLDNSHQSWTHGNRPHVPVDLDSWYNNLVGLPEEQALHEDVLRTFDSNYDVGTAVLSDVQNGVNQWATTAIRQDDVYNWHGSGVLPADQPRVTDRVNNDMPIENYETEETGPRVCYGMVHRVYVQLMGEMVKLNQELESLTREHSSMPPDVRTCTLELQSLDIVHLLLTNGTALGTLTDKKRAALVKLIGMRSMVLEGVFILSDLRTKISRITQKKDAVINIDINIYGPAAKAEEVADHLTAHKVWLQKPDYYQKSYPYNNPHMIHFPELEGMEDEQPTAENPPSVPDAAEADGRVRQLEQAVLAASHRITHQRGVAGDVRLKTNLLSHQEKGLSFMLERESGEIPDEFRLWQPALINGREMFVHRITKTRSHIRPDEKGGGILADEMGMGKTLSILALIIKTVQEGHEWAERGRQEELTQSKIQQHAHSTLIIAPSEWLIDEWLKEIRKHLGDAVSYLKYHGYARERDIDKIIEADIVLTTYKTLATDAASSKKDSLHRIHWFRVVLDEAHWIRRPPTTFHRACAGLFAKSRWCVTGTPIQNSLEDIGALFVFLRAEPFHSLAQFRRFIVVPFQENNPIVKDRLVMLYESLVIQRTKDLLDLPGDEQHIKELSLSQAERSLYEHTSNILARRLREQVGERETHSRFGLFQVHLQLRLLCNHGTYQSLLSWSDRSLENREAFLAEVGFNAEQVCGICRQPRPILASGALHNDFAENCKHIICAECSEDLANAQGGEAQSRTMLIHCPLCPRTDRSTQNAAPGLTQHGGEDVEMTDATDVLDSRYFNATGFSTKINEIVKDVKAVQNEVVYHESGKSRNCKSIIFSCWTRTLDLIQKHLNDEKIEHLRIDGQSLLSRRQRILKEFSSKRGPDVLLMTTGTGAYGLNLTAANRIFIVELQWNPSVERQAIARAIRINQKEKVIVTRYMMKDTVEQEMKSQQANKRRAAQVGMKEGGDGRAEGQDSEAN